MRFDTSARLAVLMLCVSIGSVLAPALAAAPPIYDLGTLGGPAGIGLGVNNAGAGRGD